MGAAQRKQENEERIAVAICDKTIEMAEQWDINLQDDASLMLALKNAAVVLKVDDQASPIVLEMAFEMVREES